MDGRYADCLRLRAQAGGAVMERVTAIIVDAIRFGRQEDFVNGGALLLTTFYGSYLLDFYCRISLFWFF